MAYAASIQRHESPARRWRGMHGLFRESSGLALIEHRRFLIENGEDFCQLGVAALHYERDVFHSAFFTPDFHGTRHVVLLLLGAVEPAQEEPGALRLLPALGAAHIEKDVWVLTEELLNGTNYGLCNLLISRRRPFAEVCQIQPEGFEIRVRIFIKINGISYAMVCGEGQVISIIENYVWRQKVDLLDLQPYHLLYPFQIVIAGLGSYLSLSFPFCELFFHLLFPCRLALPRCCQPLKDLLACAFPSCSCCFHNTESLVSGGKCRHKYPNGKEKQGKSGWRTPHTSRIEGKRTMATTYKHPAMFHQTFRKRKCRLLVCSQAVLSLR